MVHLVDYQSLERELSIADSVIDTQREIIRADSLAYARLASLRAFEDSTHTAAYATVARDLVGHGDHHVSGVGARSAPAVRRGANRTQRKKVARVSA